MIVFLKGMLIVVLCFLDVIYINKIRIIYKIIFINLFFFIFINYIIGDYIKVLVYFIEEKGIRGGLIDGDWNWDVVFFYILSVKWKVGVKYSVVILVGEEKEMIVNVIKEVKKVGVEEIIVVVNGVDEVMVKWVIEEGVIVFYYK